MGWPPNWTAAEEALDEGVFAVWRSTHEEALRREVGGCAGVCSPHVLRPVMRGARAPQGGPHAGCLPETGDVVEGGPLRGVRNEGPVVHPGPELEKQRSVEHRDVVRQLSYIASSLRRGDRSEAAREALSLVRSGRFGEVCLRSVSEPDQATWGSASEADRVAVVMRVAIGLSVLASRMDRLCVIGNGVVPLVAATAFCRLAERLGIGVVSEEGTAA